KKNNRRVNLSKATFEGVLTVTDLEAFKKTLTRGIGREKAYGMGMLTVIPFG
ncbi:MAG: type I-E CRISPR-associated protein Cas6/Cse3/CasE, partial [Ligilactobacillus agilis]